MNNTAGNIHIFLAFLALKTILSETKVKRLKLIVANNFYKTLRVGIPERKLLLLVKNVSN